MTEIGLDLGSTAAKLVWLENKKIKKYEIRSTHELHSLIDSLEDSAPLFATGYFRNVLRPKAKIITEITAAIHGTRYFFEDADVIIDIGGQDVKVIDVKNNRFQLNDKCSAGTGAFLEFMAQYLGLSLEEMSVIGGDAKHVPPINSTCSVFALSEVISQLAAGSTNEEIVAGINRAFAKRIAELAPERIDGAVVAIGGPTKNKGMIRALSETLGAKILVPDEPQIVNAVGCVMYWEQGSQPSFRPRCRSRHNDCQKNAHKQQNKRDRPLVFSIEQITEYEHERRKERHGKNTQSALR